MVRHGPRCVGRFACRIRSEPSHSASTYDVASLASDGHLTSNLSSIGDFFSTGFSELASSGPTLNERNGGISQFNKSSDKSSLPQSRLDSPPLEDEEYTRPSKKRSSRSHSSEKDTQEAVHAEPYEEYPDTTRNRPSQEVVLFSEPLSFFALKRTIEFVNKLVTFGQNDSYEQLLHLQNQVQQHINTAVLALFPNDPLDGYRLEVPENPIQKRQGIVSIASVSTSEGNERGRVNGTQSIVTTETINLKSSRRSGLVTPRNGNVVDDADAWVASQLPVKSFADLIQNDDGPASRLLQHHQQQSQPPPPRGLHPHSLITSPLFSDDASVVSMDVLSVPDVLCDARRRYMERVNSSGPADLIIPPESKTPENLQFFNSNFEFSSDVARLNFEVFGYEKFRGVQEAAINAVLSGRNVFVMMATGGGKSHIYQLPSLLLNGVVVVFSPLISLMQDQLLGLESKGIKATTVNANTNASQIRALFKELLNERTTFEKGSILFITPEKFDKSVTIIKLLNELDAMDRLKLFVIDEAHCVSQWGLSFRKDYRKLSNLKRQFPSVPILAMTATATPKVVEDIISLLQLNRCIHLKTTINRPNLWIEVREKTKFYLLELCSIIHDIKGPGIVYCLSTSEVDKVVHILTQRSISAVGYHAKMDLYQRQIAQETWTKEQAQVVVATIAFGMGIDKSNVRFVLHTSAPVSLLGYYQEIGRAGRDGKFSVAILWYNVQDFQRHKNLGVKLTATNCGEAAGASTDERQLNPSLVDMRDFCDNKSTCRRLLLFRAFGEDPSSLPANCMGCDNCCLEKTRVKVDVTEDAKTILKFVTACMQYRRKGVLTLCILCDALRGSTRKTLVKYKLDENPYHGALSHLKQPQIFAIVHEMLNVQVLRDKTRTGKQFTRTVLLVGPRARALEKGNMKLHIVVYQDAESKHCESTNSYKSPKDPRKIELIPSGPKSDSNKVKALSTSGNELDRHLNDFRIVTCNSADPDAPPEPFQETITVISDESRRMYDMLLENFEDWMDGYEMHEANSNFGARSKVATTPKSADASANDAAHASPFGGTSNANDDKFPSPGAKGLTQGNSNALNVDGNANANGKKKSIESQTSPFRVDTQESFQSAASSAARDNGTARGSFDGNVQRSQPQQQRQQPSPSPTSSASGGVSAASAGSPIGPYQKYTTKEQSNSTNLFTQEQIRIQRRTIPSTPNEKRRYSSGSSAGGIEGGLNELMQNELEVAKRNCIRRQVPTRLLMP